MSVRTFLMCELDFKHFVDRSNLRFKSDCVKF